MRVLMLSDQETTGGASIAAARTATALADAGLAITRAVHQRSGGNHPWDTVNLSVLPREPLIVRNLGRISGRAARSVQRALAPRELHGLERLIRDLKPDYINVHNIHGSVWDLRMLEVCAQHAPTLWTLHDMWSFTGRCAYSYDCTRYLSGCDAACPTPNEYPALHPLAIADAWEARRTLFRRYPHLTAVSPSRWLAEAASRGLWSGHRVEVVPNCVPTNEYRPIPREDARRALGISTQGPVLLLPTMAERRKGGAIAFEALRHLPSQRLSVIAFGSGKIGPVPLGVEAHHFGYVPDAQKVLAYNAADLLVHPAPVDNLPNTIIEALACGTPTVAFKIGGIPEIIDDGVTGWLEPQISAKALASRLSIGLSSLDNGEGIRRACRAAAEARYTPTLHAKKFFEVAQSLTPSNL